MMRTPIFDPAADTINNITVDRVYLGFLVCLKDARILNADGTEALAFTAAADNTTTVEINPGDPATEGAVFPGQIIEYRVICTNTSQEGRGSGQHRLERQQRSYP